MLPSSSTGCVKAECSSMQEILRKKACFEAATVEVEMDTGRVYIVAALKLRMLRGARGKPSLCDLASRKQSTKAHTEELA